MTVRAICSLLARPASDPAAVLWAAAHAGPCPRVAAHTVSWPRAQRAVDAAVALLLGPQPAFDATRTAAVAARLGALCREAAFWPGLLLPALGAQPLAVPLAVALGDLALLEGLSANGLVAGAYSHLLTGYIGSLSFLRAVADAAATLRAGNPDLVYGAPAACCLPRRPGADSRRLGRTQCATPCSATAASCMCRRSWWAPTARRWCRWRRW
jgi:hypothetical protein